MYVRNYRINLLSKDELKESLVKSSFVENILYCVKPLCLWLFLTLSSLKIFFMSIVYVYMHRAIIYEIFLHLFFILVVGGIEQNFDFSVAI